VVTALILAAGIALACFGLKNGITLLAGGIAVAWMVNLFFTRWLGGVTGDTMGAVNELVTVSLLLLLLVTG
jgi:adenosylcobinamide-GDP ribazoletransferase